CATNGSSTFWRILSSGSFWIQVSACWGSELASSRAIATLIASIIGGTSFASRLPIKSLTSLLRCRSPGCAAALSIVTTVLFGEEEAVELRRSASEPKGASEESFDDGDEISLAAVNADAERFAR